jgi:hypothetical protein
MNQTQTESKVWYREWGIWLLLAPLILVVILSAIAISIAYRHADDVVMDNYYKQGRMINQVLEQDRRAAELNLHADLRFDRTTGEVFLRFVSGEQLPKQLLLLLDHPFEADLDQTVLLNESAPGVYRGELERVPEFAWYLTLMPELEKSQRRTAEWILSGSINFANTEQTRLEPRELR